MTSLPSGRFSAATARATSCSFSIVARRSRFAAPRAGEPSSAVLDVEPFSRWVMAERRRLQAIAAGVFEQFAKQSDALGNGDQAIKAAERLISLEPLREDWHRLFLRICARQRSPEAADTHAKWLVPYLGAARNRLHNLARLRKRACAPGDVTICVSGAEGGTPCG